LTRFNDTPTPKNNYFGVATIRPTGLKRYLISCLPIYRTGISVMEKAAPLHEEIIDFLN